MTKATLNAIPELECSKVHPLVDEVGELVEAEEVERKLIHQLFHLPRDRPHLTRGAQFRECLP